MTSERRTLTLDDICTFASGSAFPKAYQGELSGRYPFVKVSDMNLPENHYRIETAQNWVGQETLETLGATVHPPGSVAFAKIGIALTYNRRRQLVRPTVLDNNMMSATPRKEVVDSRFLYYLLLGVDFNVISAGTALPYLRVSDLRQLTVEVPPLPEQRAIAHILGTLDDKIALNRRMSATLEEMARALFKAWFVDFEPVRAKLAGRPSASAPGKLAALFPARLVDSELGEIPEGWRVGAIGDEVTAAGGGTPSTKEAAFWEGGEIAWTTPKDLSSLNSCVLISTDRQITAKGLQKVSSGLLPKGTVLMSSRAPVGYLALAGMPLAVNQGYIAMVCDRTLNNYYVLNWAGHNMETIKAAAGGTTFAEISKRNFRPLAVIVPSQPCLAAFEEIVGPLYGRIELLEHESRSLAETRDTLLPRLVSGELRVGEAEEWAGGFGSRARGGLRASVAE